MNINSPSATGKVGFMFSYRSTEATGGTATHGGVAQSGDAEEEGDATEVFMRFDLKLSVCPSPAVIKGKPKYPETQN